MTNGWNEVTWNEVTMERSDRIPCKLVCYIMSGIIIMIYSHMNHSYDANWCVKIMSGIIIMIDSRMNHSLFPTDVQHHVWNHNFDADWSVLLISGIIT